MDRFIRIYHPGAYAPAEEILLSPASSHHLVVVLRRTIGEIITLFNGKNQEYQAVVIGDNKNRVKVRITSCQAVNRESPRIIHLAQAISKGERMDFVVQKAVELGVASIYPVISQHCVIRQDEMRFIKKQKQWQAIAISACEQSGRNTVPIIHPICSLPEFLKEYVDTEPNALKWILDTQGQHSWRDYRFPAGEIVLLVGPEGGFTGDEVALAKTIQFQSLALGPRILRTETAAIAALSVLQAVSGDL